MFLRDPWSDDARVPENWGSRQRARYIYTWLCLPVRLVIFSSLLWLCIHVDPSPSQYRQSALVLLLFLVSITCAYDKVWWSRTYLLFECVVAAFLLTIHGTIVTVSVLYALLMVHWLCSCFKAKEWWANREAAQLAADHSPRD